MKFVCWRDGCHICVGKCVDPKCAFALGLLPGIRMLCAYISSENCASRLIDRPALAKYRECGKNGMKVRPQLNYEDAVGRVSRVANAVAGAHLGLIVLDVSVLASSLPNVYVGDLAANCGARYLAGYASHYIFQSGLMVIAAVAISVVYSGWIGARNLTNTVIGYTGQWFHFATLCALGIPSLFFFISAGSQLARLGNPPRLPDSFQTTHICPALPYLP